MIRAIPWAIPVALAGCGGHFELGDVLSVDVEDAADATTNDSATADSAESWDVPTDVHCGRQAGSTNLGPCDLELAPDRRSTLCDESRGVCVAPEARCSDGWCFIPPRSFVSGAVPDSPNVEGFDAAITRVPRAFLIQETEMSLHQFAAVMGFVPDGSSNCGSDCPVAGVSPFAAMEVANRMSDAEGRERCYTLEGCGFEPITSGNGERTYSAWTCASSTFTGPDCLGYRLPTPFEWELAARAGSPYCLDTGPMPLKSEIWWCDSDIQPMLEQARYCGNSDIDYRPCITTRSESDGLTTHCLGPGVVREKIPNAFGLYGVHGNVDEWVQAASPGHDPIVGEPRVVGPPFPDNSRPEFTGTIAASDWVYVGGGIFWSSGYGMCPSSMTPFHFQGNAILLQVSGFRLVRTVPGDDVQ